MSVLFPPLLAITLGLLAAAIATGSTLQRRLAVVVSLLGILPAWLLPREMALLRAIAGLIPFVGTMRVIDLRRGQWTFWARVAHTVSFVDTRRLVRAPSTFQTRRVAIGAGWLLVASVGFATLPLSIEGGPSVAKLARWGSTLLIVYGLISAGYAIGEATYAALGFELPLLHDAPVRSRSVQELWGERWARPVSLWLGETFFRAYARRHRPILGALVAFGVSAAFHAYVAWVALGLVTGVFMAGWVFAFFVAQAIVMAMEQALRVKKWPAWAGHLWTVTWMLATAPLFLEPTARVLGGVSL